MNRPLPIIHVPTGAARRQVIDAIYAAGWQLSCCSRKEAESDLSDDRAKHYPYLIQEDGVFYWTTRTHQEGGTATLVNSPAHLVAYCKTLDDRAPRKRPDEVPL